MRLLVVAAHPDDEILGCGGTIAYNIARGDDVHVLVVTRGIPEMFSCEQIEQTRMEMAQAHKILGVSGVHFLDFPAPKLDIVPEHELADSINKVFNLLQPDIIFLPHRGDIHIDHRCVYRAGLVAARPIRDCSITRILCYETLSETEWGSSAGDEVFVPTVFVDISNYLDRKLKAMSCFLSQLGEWPHPRSARSIDNLARVRGVTVGVEAAEAFMLVRELKK